MHAQQHVPPDVIMNPTVSETRPALAFPSMYEVLILDDEFTPMEFVVGMLKQVFRKSHDESVKLMLSIHHDGEGICGIYTRDVAETKMMQVINLARESLHPLKCVIRKSV
ncbi:MAG: ATP-dependent Clp protease adapter ClpS [Hyphomicrobiales bacterium]|nr:ATP-dependent Clp protease adapter ClpS [Hyphomicrobiales bacterium]